MLEGLTKLVDEFYTNMDTLPEARTIRNMHPQDLAESRKKLTYFLSGWLGGPRLFQQHYGPISIPGAKNATPDCCACGEPWPPSRSVPN